MSPLPLSAPSSRRAFQANQSRVRFGSGNGESPKPAVAPAEAEQTDKVDLSESQGTPSGEGVKNENSGEQKPAESKNEESSKPGFFGRLKNRIGQFFHYLGKAFKKLLGPNKPKSDFEKELKLSKHLMKPENFKSRIKAEAKRIQEKGTANDKEHYSEFLEFAKSDEKMKKFIDETLKTNADNLRELNEHELKPLPLEGEKESANSAS